MKNLLLTLLLFVANLSYSQAVITDTLYQCQGDTTTLTCVFPSTGNDTLLWNCDSIVDIHMFLVNVPQNPNDSIQTWWDVNFSFIVVEPISFMFPPYMFTESGCYRFNVILNCISGGTLTLSSTRYISTVGIEELTLTNKELLRVTDMMGRQTEIEPNKLLLYQYADGSTKKVIIIQLIWQIIKFVFKASFVIFLLVIGIYLISYFFR